MPQPTIAPTSARTQCTLYALLDYYGHQLAVDETVTYTNQTGIALNDLVLALEPNHRGGFSIENLLLNGNALNYDLTGHRLTVSLPTPLEPNAQITLTTRFRILLPAKVKEHPYGYDVDQVNLTDWYAFVVPYMGGWVLHDESYLGEHQNMRSGFRLCRQTRNAKQREATHCFKYRIDGQEPVYDFLKLIRPYLTSKQKKNSADVVMKYIEQRAERLLERDALGRIRRSQYTRDEIELISSIRSHSTAKSSEAICRAPNVIG